MQDALCPINCPAINHRMFVLEGSGPDPWAADFTLKSQLNSYDQFAIDGTYFVYESKLYHIYSCWENQYSAWPANLCITSMSDPWTVSSNFSDRRMVSYLPWICVVNDNMTHISATDQRTRSAVGTSPVWTSHSSRNQRRPATTYQPKDGPKLCDILSCKSQHAILLPWHVRIGRERPNGVPVMEKAYSWLRFPSEHKDWSIRHGTCELHDIS